ncbi:MAG: hypothetical protein RIB65_03515 [Ilumatobacter fluminis]
MSASVPARLVSLAAAWSDAGKPAQPGIPWPRAAWQSAYPDRCQLIEHLPAQLTRDVVRNACRRAAESPEAAVDAFLVTMMWGYGNVGYGRYRTNKVLTENANAA